MRFQYQIPSVQITQEGSTDWLLISFNLPGYLVV